MPRHTLRIATTASLAVLALAGCSANAPAEAPADSLDERCVRQFPLQVTAPITESELEGRAENWPAAPDWAVLCWTEWENSSTQVGWYATDLGAADQVYSYYEELVNEVGVAARVDSVDGQILTGIVLPRHSFWVLAGRDQYRVTWSFDGDYDE